MYNFGGIYYEFERTVSIFAIGGVVILLYSKFWNVHKRNMKNMIFGLVCIILAIYEFVDYSNILAHPKILIHEGYYDSENRSSRRLCRMDYCFSNEKGLKPVFNLDIWTKKEIYPKDFNKKQKYRIFYEEETDTIVKIEEIE